MKIVYIDAQNTHMRTLDNWRVLDWQKFYTYMKKRYQVDKLYYATGYVYKYYQLYQELSNIWYTMLYKETLVLPDGTIKWNVDIDIAIKAISEIKDWILKRAFLVTNDWDYNSLIKSFQEYNVFGWLISPDWRTVSKLLTRISKDIIDLQRARHLLENKKTLLS
jgi:uncharacterized LabA/DUF88 family protein